MSSDYGSDINLDDEEDLLNILDGSINDNTGYDSAPSSTDFSQQGREGKRVAIDNNGFPEIISDINPTSPQSHQFKGGDLCFSVPVFQHDSVDQNNEEVLIQYPELTVGKGDEFIIQYPNRRACADGEKTDNPRPIRKKKKKLFLEKKTLTDVKASGSNR